MIHVLAEAARSLKIVTEKIYKNEPVSPCVLKGETFSFIMRNNDTPVTGGNIMELSEVKSFLEESREKINSFGRSL